MMQKDIQTNKKFKQKKIQTKKIPKKSEKKK